MYEEFRDRVSKAKIHSNMTTILMDLTEGRIIKEEPLPGSENNGQDGYFEMPLEDAGEDGLVLDDDLMQLKFKFEDIDD